MGRKKAGLTKGAGATIPERAPDPSLPDYQALKTELAKPAYTGLSDQAAADKLNTDTVTTVGTRKVVPSYEVWEAIVPSEWAALSAQEKQRVETLLGMGNVNLAGTNTRSSLTTAFAPGTQSRTNLIALQNETVTVAVSVFGQRVEYWDVARARAM